MCIRDSRAEVEAKWDALMADTREIPVAPRKTDVRVRLFGVALSLIHI